MTTSNSDLREDKFFVQKRGRRLSPAMRETLKIVRRYRQIGALELRRLLSERGHDVSKDYALKLRQRARRVVSTYRELCPPISVHSSEAKVQTAKIEEKELETSPVSPITFSQPQPKPAERGTELTTRVEGHTEAYFGLTSHGFKFGVLVPSGFYRWVRGDWNLHRFMGRLRFLRNHREARIVGNYFGVNFVVFPPAKKWGGLSHLIFSIPRPSTVREYHDAVGKMHAFVQEWGFDFRDEEIWYVQRGHYAEEGINRFGFAEPVEITFADGGSITFDRSLGIPETEYDSIDTAMSVASWKFGADIASKIMEKLEGMDKRLKVLETAKHIPSGVPSKVDTSQVPAKPVYERFLPSSWEREREAPARGTKPATYIPCSLGLSELEPDCQWRECRFSCKLWKFET